MKQWITNYMESYKAALDSVCTDTLEGIIKLLAEANQSGKQIFVFGNGGSASNTSHFITDLGKGASDMLEKRFRCMSLNEHIGWITALGNDYSYDEIFSRQMENFAKPGDIVLTMSVSGNSPNLVKAVEWANEHDLHTIALVGAKKGRLAEIAKDVMVIDSTHYGHVEDAHMMICHMLCYAFMENPDWAKA